MPLIPSSIRSQSKMSYYTSCKPTFRFGPYVPLLRQDDKIIIDPNGVVDYYTEANPLAKKLLGEVLPDDSIVDAPSMVLPLLLKKSTILPPEVDEEDQKEVETFVEGVTNCEDDEIQLIKIVDSSRSKSYNDLRGRTENQDCIKTAVLRRLSANQMTTLSIPDYSKSTSSDILLGIGLSRVHEFVLGDKCRRLSKRAKRGATHLYGEVDSIRTELAEVCKSNHHYKPNKILRCPHCPFKTDSKFVLNGHLENPHRINNRTFACNWCDYRTKDCNQITYHTYVVHRKRSRIEKSPLIHCCDFCDFESNSKVRHNSHMKKCISSYNKDSVQAPDNPEDYPGITPKFITKDDITIYESVLRDLRLAAYNPHQIEVKSHDGQMNVLLVSSNIVRAMPRTSAASIAQLASPFVSDVPLASSPNLSQSHLHQIAQTMLTNGANSNMPTNRNCMLQHPKPHSAFISNIFAVKNAENVVMAPSLGPRKSRTRIQHSHPSLNSNRIKTNSDEDGDEWEHEEISKRSLRDFVNRTDEGPVVINLEDDDHGKESIHCEICDEYIEDFSEFRTHMIESHQVKIHRKVTLSSRPPLNCQKCQCRFFTDQGLERHLLCGHGLVTTSMQDKADKFSDKGRCTLCGSRFSRLVNHVKDVHKVQLKSAELTYKCKACSAVYALYSCFENHVHQVHSGLRD